MVTPQSERREWRGIVRVDRWTAELEARANSASRLRCLVTRDSKGRVLAVTLSWRATDMADALRSIQSTTGLEPSHFQKLEPE